MPGNFPVYLRIPLSTWILYLGSRLSLYLARSSVVVGKKGQREAVLHGAGSLLFLSLLFLVCGARTHRPYYLVEVAFYP